MDSWYNMKRLWRVRCPFVPRTEFNKIDSSSNKPYQCAFSNPFLYKMIFHTGCTDEGVNSHACFEYGIVNFFPEKSSVNIGIKKTAFFVNVRCQYAFSMWNFEKKIYHKNCIHEDVSFRVWIKLEFAMIIYIVHIYAVVGVH